MNHRYDAIIIGTGQAGSPLAKRLSDAGMDADITVFDPATVQDQATYERPNQISRGVKDLLVGGIFVIRNGALDTNAFPGQPVRRSGAPAKSDDAHEQ